MINKKTASGWSELDPQTYKDEPGSWVGVTRTNFANLATTEFEMRYFEVAPGGYTSMEQHQHEHCVMVISGTGEVFLDEEWHQIGVKDFVHVPSLAVHQFRNVSDQPFGFMCVVDRVRDRPQLVEPIKSSKSK